MVQAFGCVAHVITSEPANWYLVYRPEDAAQIAVRPEWVPKGLAAPPLGKEIFVSYISPIHYNAIRAAG